jgi:putative transcriptional regulator
MDFRREVVMANNKRDIPTLVKEVRRQLGFSQEELAHELGVSFATINRWENGKTTPFKLARKQLDAFCEEMERQGRLTLP